MARGVRGEGLIAKAVAVLEAYGWDGDGVLDQAMAELAGAVLAERRRVRECARSRRGQRSVPRRPEWEGRAVSTITVRAALEEILPALIPVIGTEATREMRRRAADHMGAGGTTGDWIMAMGVAVAELDNPEAEQALLAAVDRLAKR